MGKMVAMGGVLVQHSLPNGSQDDSVRGCVWASTPHLTAVEAALQERDMMLDQLKSNLKQAQERMKTQADKHRVEKSFQVGEFVYLKLQPYRQLSIASRSNQKLSPRYYGPFRIQRKVGPVAYTLDLPESSRIHPTFHVSLLKRASNAGQVASPTLPPVTQHGEVRPVPEKALAYRQRKRYGRYVVQVLIQWQGLPEGSNSWVDSEELAKIHPKFQLADKPCFEGAGNDMPQGEDGRVGSYYKRRRSKQSRVEPIGSTLSFH